MFIAYVVVSLLLGGYLAFSAWADFVRYQQVLVAMARAGVPESWLPMRMISRAWTSMSDAVP